ncbi:MAG: DNA-processing protein DprA [Telluria sp.]
MQDTDPTQPLTDDELTRWLRLAATPGVGPKRVRRLLEAFGSPEAILAADMAALCPFLPAGVARALAAAPDEAQLRYAEQVLAWRAAPGNAVLILDTPAYSAALAQIPDPPVLLFARGRLDLLRAPGLAIVGSRNASVQGERNARAFAQVLSAAGLTVVSGLAAGIDAAAHDGALGEEGSTIAVLGTGIDIVYPARNQALAHRIAAEGLLVSEYPLGTRVLAQNFPRRNRIISGLSAAVLVVEAAAESGSLITARFAAEQGRDVMAMPGSIHAALSKGCHALIKEGAKLVDSAEDVLGELRLPRAVPNAPQLFMAMDMHAGLLALLESGTADLYTLAARTGYEPGFVSTQLLSMELDGLVERLPGGMFQKIPGSP